MIITRKILELEVKKVMRDVVEQTKRGTFSDVFQRNTYALCRVEEMLSQLLSTSGQKVIVEF